MSTERIIIAIERVIIPAGFAIASAFVLWGFLLIIINVTKTL
jgi:hypothetical protein